MIGDSEKKIPVEVIGITNASRPEFYALILAERGGDERRIPIIIGLPEAQAIAVRIQGLHSPRPLSHDIFMTMAISFQIEMVEAIIYKLHNGVFYSQVVCKQGDKIAYIDSRTSDAVALAIRFNAPIYTYDNVLDEALKQIQSIQSTFEGAQMTPPQQEQDDSELTNASREVLETLSAERLNKVMQEAIQEENYEQASIIRDILNQRNQ